MSEKVILDTDIGLDIDDAFCLAYLLAQPQCELLGITTVGYEADKRAMLASVLCKVAGKHIPIFPGAEEALLIPQMQIGALQAAALTRWDHDEDFPHGQAIEFLRHTIREYPGEVILLTIGPLTNIGLLFRTDPEIPSLLKGLVMMCGIFTNRLAGIGPREWNASCDPHATAIVYQTTTSIHRSIGLDVTCQVTMKATQLTDKLSPNLLKPVLDFAGIWFQQSKRDTVYFHDPLAATTIFDDQICVFHRGSVEVELTSERWKGITSWKPGDSEKHEVALEVNSERFFDHYFSVFP